MIAHARTTDPETSHAAAASVNDIRWSQSCILTVLRNFGAMTDEELVIVYEQVARMYEFPEQSPSGIRTRRSELARLGLVEYTGEKRPISTGRLARIWRASRI